MKSFRIKTDGETFTETANGLCEVLEVDLPTVQGFLKFLKSKGLLVEAGKIELKKGRPATIYGVPKNITLTFSNT